jgi:hypothetical protein
MALIYTYQRSKLSKKQRAKREALLKEQRELKRSAKPKHAENLKTNDPMAYRVQEYREKYPSRELETAICSKHDPLMYTGDLLIGIGQMHKSNAVPVLKQDDAKAIAQMRR